MCVEYQQRKVDKIQKKKMKRKMKRKQNASEKVVVAKF